MLSFEDFVKHDGTNPRYNNFYCHWVKWEMVGDAYRSADHYKRFAADHPEFDRILSETISRRVENGRVAPVVEKLLYDAYFEMSRYATDEELFR